MTTCEFGQIVLVAFPQTGNFVRKKRPALVILDVGDDDVVLAPITTRKRSGPGESEIHEWSKSGLLLPSQVRLAKIASLEKRDILRTLGQLTGRDKRTVADSWRTLYELE